MAVPAYGNLEARREAREVVSGPGKFEGESPMTVILYNIVMEGFSDDSWSDESGHWEDRVGRYLVGGDIFGFVWSHRCASESEAEEEIEALNAEGEDIEDED